MKELFSTIPLIKGEDLTLKALTLSDSESLKEMTKSDIVYKYLPTFLYEKKYEDKNYVIEHMYDECLRESLILGVFKNEDFCGLAEMYAYRPMINKISIGVRLIEKYWGYSIAAKASALMEKYLKNETDITLLSASTMSVNTAAGKVLKKQGYKRLARSVDEDWGFDEMTKADVWIKRHF